MWDEANAEKLRLEEKQRATRRRREAEAEQAAAEGWLNTVFLLHFPFSFPPPPSALSSFSSS